MYEEERKLYSDKLTDIQVITKHVMDNEKIVYYNADVISNRNVRVDDFIFFFITKICPKSKGTVSFIDGTEQNMDEAMNGQSLCSYYGDKLSYISNSKSEVFNRPVRFATFKISKIPGCKFSNLILFVPKKRKDS